jgi:response regulator RpfG family c-di-GMP phosphodiesterase
MSEHEQVMNIPVVDDNPDNLRLLAEILSEPHYNETLDEVKAFTLGGVDYITKPFKAEEVLSRVKTHLSLSLLRRQLEKKNSKLQKALDEIKILQGIIPICASCKNVRDDKGYWDRVEIYISKHSEAEFSHSICPNCTKALYPGFSCSKNGD